jgi:hypothetical protein
MQNLTMGGRTALDDQLTRGAGGGEWPAAGARVVVWSERPPSPTPRDPHESIVDHVAGRTFTVAGHDATFNRSTGRSKPVPRGPGAFAFETYVAVDLGSERAHEVLGAADRRDREAEATRAVQAWLGDRSSANRHAAI